MNLTCLIKKEGSQYASLCVEDEDNLDMAIIMAMILPRVI
jgi:hypothetical protein